MALGKSPNPFRQLCSPGHPRSPGGTPEPAGALRIAMPRRDGAGALCLGVLSTQPPAAPPLQLSLTSCFTTQQSPFLSFPSLASPRVPTLPAAGCAWCLCACTQLLPVGQSSRGQILRLSPVAALPSPAPLPEPQPPLRPAAIRYHRLRCGLLKDLFPQLVSSNLALRMVQPPSAGTQWGLGHLVWPLGRDGEPPVHASCPDPQTPAPAAYGAIGVSVLAPTFLA